MSRLLHKKYTKIAEKAKQGTVEKNLLVMGLDYLKSQ